MFAAMWRVLTHPSLSAFEDARANANFGRAIVGTFAVGFGFGALRGFLHWLVSSHPAAEIVTLAVMTGFSLLASLIVAQAVLLIAVRAIGGRGDFATQTYLTSLAYAPLNAIAISADIVPNASNLIVFGVSIYSTVLIALALRVAHDRQKWRAPMIVVLGLALIGQIIGWLVLSSIPQ